MCVTPQDVAVDCTHVSCCQPTVITPLVFSDSGCPQGVSYLSLYVWVSNAYMPLKVFVVLTAIIYSGSGCPQAMVSIYMS